MQENQKLFEPPKNPAELGETCKKCKNYWRQRFVSWSKASTGRCKLQANARIKANQPACTSFEKITEITK
jgi:hypothetical protein